MVVLPLFLTMFWLYMYCNSQLYKWWKPEYQEKTYDLMQVTNTLTIFKLYCDN